MVLAEPEFTLGIEEEYFLVNRATRDVVGDPPDVMLAEFEVFAGRPGEPRISALADRVGTRVCATLEEARAELRRLRGGIAAVAARHGMAPIAAATHPFARWEAQAARTEALAAV
jgi:carboxylate-amine ligase